jgi:GAF domain-containing protein
MMSVMPERTGDDRIVGEQAALRRVATLVARAAAPEEVFAAVTEEAGRLLGAHHATMGRYDLGHGLIGVAVAAWPAVALVGSYELLMLIIRGAQSPEAEANVSEAGPARGPEADPLQARATGEFAAQLASGTVPSIRVIRARLHVGQPRAQQVRAYLAETVRQTAA